jgi:dephospho-CoA kinase
MEIAVRDTTLCQVKHWDTAQRILSDYIADSSFHDVIIMDGPIGGGKTTLVEYLEKMDYGIHIYVQEPIEEVRKITKRYYGKELTIEQVNNEICAICEKAWCDKVGTEQVYCEHIPNPVHHWIYEKDFGTKFEDAQKSTLVLLSDPKARKRVIDDFMRVPLLDRALASPSLAGRPVRFIIVMPSVEDTIKQIKQRGRGEENILSESFIKYQCSKFERLIWEKYERGTRGEVEKNIEMLVKRFPHY